MGRHVSVKSCTYYVVLIEYRITLRMNTYVEYNTLACIFISRTRILSRIILTTQYVQYSMYYRYVLTATTIQHSTGTTAGSKIQYGILHSVVIYCVATRTRGASAPLSFVYVNARLFFRIATRTRGAIARLCYVH